MRLLQSMSVLLLTLAVAVGTNAVITFADSNQIVGAQWSNDCKNPCDEDGIYQNFECDHKPKFPKDDWCEEFSGPYPPPINGACCLQRCTWNVVRYINCTPGAKADKTANDCTWYNDETDWLRKVGIFAEHCLDYGYNTDYFGECSRTKLYDNFFVPCLASTCGNGTFITSYVQSLGRTKCGAPP